MSGIYSPTPGAGERDTTLRDLLSVVFKRKWLILGIFGVTSVFIGVKTLTTTTTYSADATLLLNRQGARSSVLERNTRQLPWVEVVESEIEVVQSMPVMQKALAKLTDPSSEHPIDITLGQLSKSIQAGVVGESNVIYVTGTSDIRANAPLITNAVAESYVEYHDQLFQLPDPVGMITARSDSVFRLMEALQKERTQILQELGAGDIAHQNRTLTTRQDRMGVKLADAESKIAQLEAEIADAKDFLEHHTGVLPFPENTGSVQGGSLSELVRRLNRQEDNLQQLRSKYTEQHPLIVETRQTIEGLQSQVDRQVAEVIAGKEHELRVAKAARLELKKQRDAVDSDIARILAKSGRLKTLNSQINSLERQYAALSEQSVDSEITSQSFRDYGVKILSPAIGATVNAKGDMVRLALGPILALMAGIGLAFYLENLDHSLTNREDIEQHLEIPVLASFPETDDARRGPPDREDPVPYRRKGSRAKG